MIALAYIGAAIGFTCLLIVMSALWGQPDEDVFEGASMRDHLHSVPDDLADVLPFERRHDPDHPAVGREGA